MNWRKITQNGIETYIMVKSPFHLWVVAAEGKPIECLPMMDAKSYPSFTAESVQEGQAALLKWVQEQIFDLARTFGLETYATYNTLDDFLESLNED